MATIRPSLSLCFSQLLSFLFLLLPLASRAVSQGVSAAQEEALAHVQNIPWEADGETRRHRSLVHAPACAHISEPSKDNHSDDRSTSDQGAFPVDVAAAAAVAEEDAVAAGDACAAAAPAAAASASAGIAIGLEAAAPAALSSPNSALASTALSAAAGSASAASAHVYDAEVAASVASRVIDPSADELALSSSAFATTYPSVSSNHSGAFENSDVAGAAAVVLAGKHSSAAAAAAGLPGLPPLPVVDEVKNLWSFFSNGFDDLVEDSVKLLCFGALYHCGVALAVAFGNGGRVPSSFAGITFGLLGFGACNEAADVVAEQVDLMDDPNSAKRRFNESEAGRLVDDLVEDSFKGACVGAHYSVGKLVSSKYILPLAEHSRSLRRDASGYFWVLGFALAEAFLRCLGFSVVLGNAAKYYSSCNDYGDSLGDFVQSWFEGFV